MTVWLDGTLHADGFGCVDPADRGLLLGDGVFETIRAEAGGAVWLTRHLARLRDGAGVLGIPVDWDDATITDAIASVMRAQGLLEAAMRVTVTRGAGPRGLLPPAEPRPSLLIGAAPLPPVQAPARLVIARATRRNEFSPLSRIKSLNYADAIIARREAAARGADDALLLNTRGAVAGGTAANVFALIDGSLVTPPIEDGALPGLVRRRWLDAGRAVTRRIWPADLMAAEAMVLTNSLAIRAAASLDGHEFRRELQ